MSKKTIIFLSIILILLAGAGVIFLPDILEKTQSFLFADKLTQSGGVNVNMPNQEDPRKLPLPPFPDKIQSRGLLYFFPNIITVKKGEEFSISLTANTFEQELAGLDAVLKYEQGKLKFNKVVNAPGLNLVFPKDPSENLVFSLLAPADKVFKGEIKVADLYFQALAAGQVDVSFVAQAGSTSDTNLIAAGQGEILSQADGFSVIVE